MTTRNTKAVELIVFGTLCQGADGHGPFFVVELVIYSFVFKILWLLLADLLRSQGMGVSSVFERMV
jgi:hypothetical protein